MGQEISEYPKGLEQKLGRAYHIFRISAGYNEDSIHDECRRKLPQNSAEIHEIQVDFSYL